LASVVRTPITPLKDWSWPDGTASVVEFLDGRGARWIVKRHRFDERYRTERTAYERWVPAIADRAPKLAATDDTLRTLLLSSLPRDGTDWHDDSVRRDAGAVLRRLHDAEPIEPSSDLAAEKLAELEEWERRGGGLVTRREADFARWAVRALATFPVPERVPCHRDYTPRNWILRAGRVHVVDFEEMRPEPWVTDLGRMAIGSWRDEPEMMDPVLDGYGRYLTANDMAIMRCLYTVTAVRHIVLGSELDKVSFTAENHNVLGHLMAVLP
jgi:thiamine kinase-like enzyme